MSVPGLGPLLRTDLESQGLAVGPVELTRQADIVPFRGPGSSHPRSVLAEDLFVEVGAAKAVGDGDSLVSLLAEPGALERGLSVWAQDRQPLRRSMTYRVVARVQNERRFLRTELRDALGAHLHNLRPRWRVEDPAQLEFWILETRREEFRLGLRLSSAATRQHGGRRAERHGALRPTVAAAMVRLAGGPGRLLDPCCGSGTILGEGLAAGWRVVGSDIDDRAVANARTNFPAAEDIQEADAKSLDWPDASFDAVVSNLPFGKQFGVSPEWFGEVFREFERLMKLGGNAVLLSSHTDELREAGDQVDLQFVDARPITLLGMRAAITRFRKRP